MVCQRRHEWLASWFGDLVDPKLCNLPPIVKLSEVSESAVRYLHSTAGTAASARTALQKIRRNPEKSGWLGHPDADRHGWAEAEALDMDICYQPLMFYIGVSHGHGKPRDMWPSGSESLRINSDDITTNRRIKWDCIPPHEWNPFDILQFPTIVVGSRLLTNSQYSFHLRSVEEIHCEIEHVHPSTGSTWQLTHSHHSRSPFHRQPHKLRKDGAIRSNSMLNVSHACSRIGKKVEYTQVIFMPRQPTEPIRVDTATKIISSLSRSLFLCHCIIPHRSQDENVSGQRIKLATLFESLHITPENSEQDDVVHTIRAPRKGKNSRRLRSSTRKLL
jgi:hypothetical protein